MTQPEDPQSQSENQTSPAQDEDSALVPAILAAYAAYLSWRGSHDSVPAGWQQLASALKLRRLLTTSMQMMAQRALAQHRLAAGAAGDELWTGADEAVLAGVESGVQTVAEGLVWTDKKTPNGMDPVTREGAEGDHPGPYLPTASDPPTLLAQMAGSAVRNSTIAAAGAAAGWDKKQWHSQRDSRVRETHVVLDGKVVAVKDVFVSPSGARLRWPGDPKASMAERAGCRCVLAVVRR